jgi:hypothetical protein
MDLAILIVLTVMVLAVYAIQLLVHKHFSSESYKWLTGKIELRSVSVQFG